MLFCEGFNHKYTEIKCHSSVIQFTLVHGDQGPCDPYGPIHEDPYWMARQWHWRVADDVRLVDTLQSLGRVVRLENCRAKNWKKSGLPRPMFDSITVRSSRETWRTSCIWYKQPPDFVFSCSRMIITQGVCFKFKPKTTRALVKII